MTLQLGGGTVRKAAGADDAICRTDDHRTFSVYIENDSFAGGDNQYTSGLKLTWSRFGLSELPDDAWLHKWLYPVIKKIGFDRPASAEKALTFSVGQSIYTPDDINRHELVKDDRPYAGITYAEVGFHRRTIAHMHTLGLYAGIVGPDSGAEQIQIEFHDLINSEDPEGWEHQLDNEPVLGLVYDYKKRLFNTGSRGEFGSDVIFSSGCTLGNARVCGNMGMLFRCGWSIPSDFGDFPIQPATCFNAEMEEEYCRASRQRFGAHIFLLANANAVAHNIFLDGNTFTDSHSVDKKPLVGTLMGGLGLNGDRFKLVLAYVYRSKSFDHQDEAEVYGSINFSVTY